MPDDFQFGFQFQSEGTCFYTCSPLQPLFGLLHIALVLTHLYFHYLRATSLLAFSYLVLPSLKEVFTYHILSGNLGPTCNMADAVFRAPLFSK